MDHYPLRSFIKLSPIKLEVKKTTSTEHKNRYPLLIDRFLGLHWIPAEQEDSRTEQVGSYRGDVQQKTAVAGANDQTDRTGNHRGRRSGRCGRGGGSNVSGILIRENGRKLEKLIWLEFRSLSNRFPQRRISNRMPNK